MAPDITTTAVELLSPDQPGGHEPALAVMGTTPHIAWVRNGIIYHAYRKGGAWAPPAEVAMGSQPVLAASPDGHLHCLFVNQFAGNNEIYHAVWDGGEWSLPQNVSHTGGDSTQPALAVGHDGTLHAVWSDTTPSEAVVYYGSLTGPFWSAEPIPNAAGLFPTLVVGTSGHTWAAWQAGFGGGTTRDILCAHRQAGAWGLPENVSNNPTGQALEPSLATDARGLAFLVWQQPQGQVYQVFYSQRLPDGWTKPGNLSADNQDCLQPVLAAAPFGMTEVAWLEAGGVRHRARLPQVDANWLETDSIATAGPVGAVAAADLAIATGADGWVHLVWNTLSPSGEWHLHYAQRQPALGQHMYFPALRR